MTDKPNTQDKGNAAAVVAEDAPSAQDQALKQIQANILTGDFAADVERLSLVSPILKTKQVKQLFDAAVTSALDSVEDAIEDDAIRASVKKLRNVIKQ